MEKTVYTDVQGSEGGWWYQGRLYALRSVLPRYIDQRGQVLDLGAGFGAMYSLLSTFGSVSAFDTYPACVTACKKRGYSKVYATFDALKEDSDMYTLVGAFDSLEHIEDDAAVLGVLCEKLSPGGIFVATVPAHPFLFGAYDVAAHHFRRYSRRSLRKLFENADLDVLYMTYWNASLFLPAALLRGFGVGGASMATHPILDPLFKILVYVESLILRILPLPFGLSLIVVARKKS